ncbi:MAG: ATP-binding cassette domain-containing protein, partial [Solirubrobacterales bacterium]|nr:ATP-binding cassette domain-containing protein [Solirubrobacterales bacterium]
MGSTGTRPPRGAEGTTALAESAAPSAPREVPLALELRGVAKRYAGIDVLAEASLAVHPGEIHALVGENGAGKSTLLRIAAGLTPPTDGSFDVPGDTVSVLGLGASFDGTLTGCENALTALVVNGVSRRAAAAELPRVREFAELED